MDAYPEDYIAHNLPYVLLCGLEADTEDPAESPNVQYPFLFTKGTEVSSDLPPVSGPVAEELRKALLEEDASEAPWNSLNEIRRTGGIGLKVKSIGRVGQQLLRAVELAQLFRTTSGRKSTNAPRC